MEIFHRSRVYYRVSSQEIQTRRRPAVFHGHPTSLIRIAEFLVFSLGIYIAAGILFAIPFVFRGVDRIDPAARESSRGFRFVIVPGVVVLWPLLARRWIAGSPPPCERNAHRDAARESGS